MKNTDISAHRGMLVFFRDGTAFGRCCYVLFSSPLLLLSVSLPLLPFCLPVVRCLSPLRSCHLSRVNPTSLTSRLGRCSTPLGRMIVQLCKNFVKQLTLKGAGLTRFPSTLVDPNAFMNGVDSPKLWPLSILSRPRTSVH
jgi:hypothetical protein